VHEFQIFNITTTTTATLANTQISDIPSDAPSNPRRDIDLSYCSVKTGVNDLLDYMAIAVSLVIPLVIGPLVVGVFQVSIQ